MKKRIVNLLITLLVLSTLNGCIFSTTGESLKAFSDRMNELNQNYSMTADGYIIDTEKSSLTKFFKFSENEIMLDFRYDKKHRLTELNITFDPIISEKDSTSYTFICDCIKSFCQNNDVAEEIFITTDFQNTIKKNGKETISAEADNIKIEIDTTQLGTVITVYKDVV